MLPPVYSTTVPPGFSRPSASAREMTALRHAVLHAAGRVLPLELDEDVRAVRRHDLAQPDERGVADGVEDVHGSAFSDQPSICRRARRRAARTRRGDVPPIPSRRRTDDSGRGTRRTSGAPAPPSRRPRAGPVLPLPLSGSSGRRARARCGRRRRGGRAPPRCRWRATRDRSPRVPPRAEGAGPRRLRSSAAERRLERVGGVEERLLRLLQVAVVGERQALHDVSVATRSPSTRPALPRDELERRPGSSSAASSTEPVRVRVRELEEAELVARPEDQVFRQPREVHHRERGGGLELDDEVAVGRRRPGCWPVTPEGRARARGALAVERQRRPGAGARAERRDARCGGARRRGARGRGASIST